MKPFAAFRQTMLNVRTFSTIAERGLAAEIREKFNVPRHVSKILHEIVHEKNDKPTLHLIPQELIKRSRRSKLWNKSHSFNGFAHRK